MTSIQSSARGSLRRTLWALGFGAVLVSAVPGCLAHASGELVYEHPAEYVEPPPRVEYYPSVHYRGAPAYLVEGRWYYRTRDRWIVFRDEPSELRDYRVRQAPAYLAPHRDQRSRRDYVRAERRAEERRHEERRRHEAERQRRAEERRAEERRRDEEQRRAEQFRRAEEQRRHERQQRADERRRHFDEQQRAAQHRAAEERRDNERRGRHASGKRNRSDDDDRGHGRGERDRRQFRHD